MRRSAKADVTPVRQRTQYTCMATSMMMCLRALGHDVSEDEVNAVLGARPMKGASWEQMLACAQHFGCRATLTMPSTVQQLKSWTDRGIPIVIAWNPEGRPWSHASVVFDVDKDDNIHIADPNIPDPDETVRIVPKGEFYSKWVEKWPDYLVRRPACAIEREIATDGTPTMKTANPALRNEIDKQRGSDDMKRLEEMDKEKAKKKQKAKREKAERLFADYKKKHPDTKKTPEDFMGWRSWGKKAEALSDLEKLACCCDEEKEEIPTYFAQPARNRREPVKASVEPTVGNFVSLLTAYLTQYDMKEQARARKRGRYHNINALAHWLGAANKVEADVRSVKNESTPEAMDILKSSLARRFTDGFPPANALLRAVNKWLETGKKPKYPIMRKAASHYTLFAYSQNGKLGGVYETLKEAKLMRPDGNWQLHTLVNVPKKVAEDLIDFESLGTFASDKAAWDVASTYAKNLPRMAAWIEWD